MIRLNHLVRSPELRILRLDHQPDTEHSDPEEEVCSNYAINFVEAGSFGLATKRETWTLSPGCVFISQPGAVHHYSHHEPIPSDICLSVIYSGLLTYETDSRDSFVPRNLPTAIPPSNRLAFLRLRLIENANDDYSMGLEHCAYEIASAVSASTPSVKRLYSDRQLKWYAERVESVCRIFETRYAEPHTLSFLARSVGMSAFQFARVFAELVGKPPHHYLIGVRLDRAAEMLLDGRTVTEACYEVGFANLSHFTRSFTRKFGCVPSLLRSRRGAQQIALKKKI